MERRPKFDIYIFNDIYIYIYIYIESLYQITDVIRGQHSKSQQRKGRSVETPEEIRPVCSRNQNSLSG